jgi:CRISPR-associated endonuclease Csn1
MMQMEQEYLLGLDLGSTSIGWAMIGLKNGEPANVIRLGCRIFQEGVDSDSKVSKNETRRIKRGMRRQRRRRNERKRRLLELLKEQGLCSVEPSSIDEWRNLNPYPLRAKGLDERLSLYEFGRVLFHLNQRRGFQSNRKATAKESEKSVVKEGMEATRKAISASNARTIGEYLNMLEFHERKRGLYVDRALYIQEFEMLWEKQSSFYPAILTKELHDLIRDKTIFFQRRLHAQAHLIGKCTLELGKKRCPKARLIFQEFRIWQQLNMLEAYDDTGEVIVITAEHRKKLYAVLDRKAKLTFDQMRKTLGFHKSIKFNLEEGERPDLPGNTTNARLAHEKAFGDRWFSFSPEMQNHIVDVLIAVEKEEKIKELAIEKWGCDEITAETLSKLNLEPDYASYSEKALKKLVPFLKEGHILSEALEKAGYRSNGLDNASLKKLSFDDELKLGAPKRLTNPLVNQALVELRKVINNLIRVYGCPKTIRLEMARDLKATAKEREKRQRENNINRAVNNKAFKELKKLPQFTVTDPKPGDILKYRLWMECKGICPYTGLSISKTQLFTNEIQIEHILPFSRSLDDSYMNKTLCFTKVNAAKGNRTPFEAFGNTPDWDEMLQRIREFPKPKKSRFRQQELKLDDFVQRQLNDTRYISREAKAYLSILPATVTVSTGQATAHLRRLWGLNSILGLTDDIKLRDDHRHHAIDAAVVAITDMGMLSRLSRTHAAFGEMTERMPDPWQGFRNEMKERVADIIVSHRPTRDLRGALHEESYYGPTGLNDQKKQDLYVIRKAVHALSAKEVLAIRDQTIQNLLTNEIEKRGGYEKAIKTFEGNPLMLKDGLGYRPIRTVRILVPITNVARFKDENGKFYKAAQYGNNHHIAIFEYTDKKGRQKRNGEVVTMFEAARRAKLGLPIVNRNQPESGDFVVSLAANDSVLYNDGQVYRIQKIDGRSGQITMRLHNIALSGQFDPGVLRCMPNTFKGRKISVSPIGDYTFAND